MQEWDKVQFDRKTAKIANEGTQEFMSTGRMFYTNPASYEYVHVNTNKKFTSNHAGLEDAVAEYRANPDRDLSFEELMHKNLRIKSEQAAKVFVQVYLGGKELTVREMKVLAEKFARIDKYRSNEFVAINDITAPYEYVHLNEHVKFTSEHEHISDASKAYLKDYSKSHLALREPYEIDNNLGQIL
jgi:hypothetical protein